MKPAKAPPTPEIMTLRSGGLRSSIDLLHDLGHDPAPLALANGLTLDVFRDPETEIPMGAALRLLGACVRISGLPHFCVMAGARNSLATLGVFGLIAQTAPDVRTAIDDLMRFLTAHDRFAEVRLTSAGDAATLHYVFHYPALPGAELATDLTITALTRMLRALCGEGWAPTEVSLPRPRPGNVQPFVDTLGSDVAFGAEAGAIAFPRHWLARTPPGANPSLRSYFTGLVRMAVQASGSDADRVRRIARLQLVSGRPSADAAAAALGLHRRTMARRLAAEGLTFKQLVGDLRFELACDLLTTTSAPMAQIAEMLGYSDQTVFSRAFSRRYGRPPSQMRKTPR